MIRISVSDLESYRYWKDNEDSTLEQLLVRLRHEEPPGPNMEAGRAFAKVMETHPDGELEGVGCDGWRFEFQLDCELERPPVRELKAEVELHTPSGIVTLVGKVDGLAGLTVHDQKLTEKWDAEKYIDSLQWRAYLVMFQAQTFVYDVFVGRYSGKRVTIYDYHRLPFCAYPGMRADVERAVAELAEIVATYIGDGSAARARVEEDAARQRQLPVEPTGNP